MRRVLGGLAYSLDTKSRRSSWAGRRADRSPAAQVREIKHTMGTGHSPAAGMGRFRLTCWDRLKIIGIVAVAACVGSCARTWIRPGADAADLEREKFECQFEASKIVGSAGTEAPVAGKRDELEGLCMEAKGWSRSWGR
jgi:hypothetical protein